MFITKVVSKKLPQGNSNHKVVVEIRMSQSEESNSITACNHNLNLSSAAELTGKYVKYYVRADMTIPLSKNGQNAAQQMLSKIVMDASRIALKTSGQLPFIANV